MRVGLFGHFFSSIISHFFLPLSGGGGRVERRCWVNVPCRGVLLVWMIVGQGLIALAVGAGGGCLDIFSLVYLFSFLSPSLWETARYRLKYCLKGPLSPKQPTNIYMVTFSEFKRIKAVKGVGFALLFISETLPRKPNN